MAIFGTSVEVTHWFDRAVHEVAEGSKDVALAVADVAVAMAAEKVKEYTPDEVDKMIDSAVAQIRERLHLLRSAAQDTKPIAKP